MTARTVTPSNATTNALTLPMGIASIAGMSNDITRRDFMNGVAIAVAGALGANLTGAHAADSAIATGATNAEQYPPSLAGLRGSHAGSFEAAHRLRDGSAFDLSQAQVTEHYDLVVVGAGISGLAAAHFYRQRRHDARVLILDTNDDFGGHAKRNEFSVDGRTLIGYGGTQSIDGPVHKWDRVARGLLNDLGIDLTRFTRAFDEDFYSRWKLNHATFFKKEMFGVDRLVRRPFGTWSDWDEGQADAEELRDYVDEFPLSQAARTQLIELCLSDNDVLAGKTKQQRLEVLEHTSYRDFLIKYWHADEQVLKYLQTRTHELWAVGIDAVPAIFTLSMPGLKAQRAVLPAEPEEPYIYHFPDGNASIARMLVRKLIPGSAPGTTMEDIVLARFDYAQLDRPGHSVRIRLGSTAVEARNVDRGDHGVDRGDHGVDHGVEVCYVNGGSVTRIAAKDCVLACYHAMIPYIAPETSAEQRAALQQNVRAPLVYVNVVVRNWHPWHKLGVAYIDNPGGTYAAYLDFPVSLDGYRFSSDPSQPICIHMIHTPCAPNQGLDMRQQFRAGRARLYTMAFADFEREIRDELARMLGSAGFDFDRDVAAITVNRWPHGYAYSPTPLYDEPKQQALTEKTARQRLGRIAIANSDSGWDAYTHIAIDQAHRAVSELIG